MKSHLVIAAIGALLTIYLVKFHSPASYTEDQWDSEFMNFVSEFRKSYGSQEDFIARREIFKQNYLQNVKHNNEGDQSYKLGVNQFSDLTEQEFKQILGLRIPNRRTITIDNSLSKVGDTIVDWRD